MDNNKLNRDDYYDVLGVKATATQEEISRAYKQLAKKYHPDKNNGDDTKFILISEAYGTIGDEDKRQAYNEMLYGLLNMKRWSGIFGDSTVAKDFHKTTKKKEKTGKDIEISISVSFLDSVNGVNKTITVNRVSTCPTCMSSDKKCTHCSGKGTVKDSIDLVVEVKPDMDFIEPVVFKGMGDSGPKAGPRGNVLVDVCVESDPVFWREGDNIHQKTELSFIDLTLGCYVSVPTISGEDFTIAVPPGTQTGTDIIVPKFGVGDGAMVVKVEGVVSEALTDDWKELLEKIREIEWSFIDEGKIFPFGLGIEVEEDF